jgi:hypothetical protein
MVASERIQPPQEETELEALLLRANASTASGLLATKDDITNIKIEMADIKTELKLMKWMVVTIVAGVISLVAKAFF